VVVNVRATQTLTIAGLSADKLELRVGPSVAAVAAGGSGGFSLAVWESGITGIALMIGAGIQDGGQLFADVPAGWYFQVNRLSGTSATVVSCFTQSMMA
jgi:predicted cupin superfamily sugar epimerase